MRISIILALALLAVLPLRGGSQDPFPLKQGNFWIYHGKVRWTVHGSSEVLEKEMDWKMEVLSTEEKDGKLIATMKGHPQDLAWYEEGKQRSDYRIIRAASEKYYLLGEQQLELNDDNVFLEMPLEDGKIFAGATEDGMYGWMVWSVKESILTGVRGITQSLKSTEYQLAYRSNPDHSFLYFRPGVGITRYVYEHNGTISEVDVRLVECQLSK